MSATETAPRRRRWRYLGATLALDMALGLATLPVVIVAVLLVMLFQPMQFTVTTYRAVTAEAPAVSVLRERLEAGWAGHAASPRADA